MKLIAVNGSPRPNFNTAKLVKEALRGAQDAGAETEYIDLYKLQNKGCISCFLCKRIGEQSCVCQVNDEMKSLFERILEADALVIGSPVYFGDVTALTEAFIERLAFPALSYDNFSSDIYTGSVNCGIIFTMNTPDASIYDSMIDRKRGALKMLNGTVETYESTFTVQFTDYSKYHSAALGGDERIKHQSEQFPKDMQAAYEMGKRLVSGSGPTSTAGECDCGCGCECGSDSK